MAAAAAVAVGMPAVAAAAAAAGMAAAAVAETAAIAEIATATNPRILGPQIKKPRHGHAGALLFCIPSNPFRQYACFAFSARTISTVARLLFRV